MNTRLSFLQHFFATTCLLAVVSCPPVLQALDVTNVTARQRWPWNNLVDIDFTVITNGIGDLPEYGVAITATCADGAKTLTPSTFTSDCFAKAGANRLTWNLGADYPGLRATDLAITVAVSTNNAETSAYLVVDLSAGPSAASYPVRYVARPPDLSNDVCRTSELWLRRVQAGSFIMGTPLDEVGRNSGGVICDADQKAVTLTQPYYIGVFHVTQRQWYNVMGTWPSYLTNMLYRDSRPVEQVSYDMIRGSSAQGGGGWPTNSAIYSASFVGLLRQKTGISGFDLPTEAQYEYACRAGTTAALNSGVNITNVDSDANVALLARYRYNGGGTTAPADRNCGITLGTATVGSYLPNAWGLYDMHGNVFVWCLDWWVQGVIPGGTDPEGPVTGTERLRRGGGYSAIAGQARSGTRWKGTPSTANWATAFRIAVRP